MTAPRNRHLIDLGIPGWLRVEDALKLYELAYFSSGNVLELGTSRGLSTSILARALLDAGKGYRITTIDIQQSFIDQAKAELEERKLDGVVDFLCGDAAVFLDEFEAKGIQFGFAFVDHSHAYEPVLKACQSLGHLLMPRSFALFHDYTDRRNTSRHNVGESGEEYGVFAATEDGLSPEAFEFYGCYGCCGLFYRR
jgi:SAM-dependent methyltransferase